LSDGQQQLDFTGFAELLKELQPFFTAVGKTV